MPVSVRDGALEGAADSEDLGFAVRVVLDGAWGFASGVALTETEAVRVAETAVSVAKVAARMTSRRVELAPEPVYSDVVWRSSYEVNPLEVPLAEKTGLFAGWTSELLAADGRADDARALLAPLCDGFVPDGQGAELDRVRAIASALA